MKVNSPDAESNWWLPAIASLTADVIGDRWLDEVAHADQRRISGRSAARFLVFPADNAVSGRGASAPVNDILLQRNKLGCRVADGQLIR
ncbi:hypothetical protein AO501_28490 [Mycobacterium gordonae]|uniref:Uncharacterized protein n=2 Tax=Mycobacterium gordonae TaxID=1778 RepID=A0A0Q2LWA3_MYCGO|nr:hypothetical protein [Mycobacterium sp. TY813]KQH80193.1 hypothetical protein AO501_28490 [Mycobacterium gordonae]MDP7732518.1 hypothetical protein [Mycobacterium sp. TY813]